MSVREGYVSPEFNTQDVVHRVEGKPEEPIGLPSSWWSTWGVRGFLPGVLWTRDYTNDNKVGFATLRRHSLHPCPPHCIRHRLPMSNSRYAPRLIVTSRPKGLRAYLLASAFAPRHCLTTLNLPCHWPADPPIDVFYRSPISLNRRVPL
jgi:hypothetical protein